MRGSEVVARATGGSKFQTRIDLPGGAILADEPIEVGGLGTGPTPYQLLSAALAACTSMTMRLYAERKGWPLPEFSVEVVHSKEPGEATRDRFTRSITFADSPDGEAEARLLEIADKCPVHRTLIRGFEIVTSAGRHAPVDDTEPVTAHEKDMEAACAD